MNERPETITSRATSDAACGCVDRTPTDTDRDVHRDARGDGTKRPVVFRPHMDLHEFEDRYELRADVPGTTAEHIEVTLDDGVLTIDARVPDRFAGLRASAAAADAGEGHRAGPSDVVLLASEYAIGDYRGRIRLGEDVEPDRIEGRYVDGVLTLDLPKRTGRVPRRVSITAG